jgi:type IV pilus assembly protein PilW
MATRRRAAAGFSLVELMISLTIGLFVLAGLVSVLMANRQAFTIQQGSSFNQENLRFASSRLAWSLRMVDFWGGIKSKDITTSTNVTGMTGIGDCKPAWVMSVGPSSTENGIRGYDGAASFPIANCVSDGNYLKGSDVVVVRYADTHGYDPSKAAGNVAFDSATAGAVPNSTSVFLLSAVAQQGTIFRKGEAVPSNPLGSTSGRYVYPFQFEMYYLRPCSDPGPDNVCGTADDGDAASPVPTLMRMRMDTTGSLVSEAVVDGVEQMQFEYASPGTPFQNAASANFPTVTQVRVSLVMRSSSRDTTVSHGGTFTPSPHCSYTISATGGVTFPGDAAANTCSTSVAASYGTKPQQFVRLTSSQVVLLRNRVRG